MKRLIQPALLIATLAFMAAPLLTPPFMGYAPGVFPVRIDRPSIQPAGYAFSIWGLIYLWLIAHAGFGLFARRNKVQFTQPGLPLLAAVALGSVWLAIAGSFPILATFAILIMAALALTAFLIADPAQDR